MIKMNRSNISLLLEEIAKSLDIPDSLFKEAEEKYKAVGRWLGEGNSPLAAFSPQIYPQGSFLLGTVTRPADDSDDFDLDLVFELMMQKGSATQKKVKDLVGDRLKANEVYRKMLDNEGRRCWTLHYADGLQFHMDILPPIPDEEFRIVLNKFGVSQSLAETSLAITDNTLPDYEQITSNWPRSNPKGFAGWFKQQMLIRFKEQQRHFAEAYKAEIDEVPEYRIKTPLQRTIQLLKRHRDLVFVDDPDIQPASIIITTLAARAYNNEADLVEAMVNIVDGMPKYIKVKNGIAWIENPVDPTENFADRWQDNPAREPNFYKWLRKVKEDLNRILSCDDLDYLAEMLVTLFGERVTTSAVKQYKESVSKQAVGVSSLRVKKPAVVHISKPLEPWGE